MKQYFVTAAVILIAVQFTAAQIPQTRVTPNEKQITFATKNLLNGLRSGNTGVIESCMRLTAQMKMRFPESDVNGLVEVINEIRERYPSGATRYKAHIALSICENPGWFITRPEVTGANEETFYRAASVRLQEQLLSANK